MANDFLLLDDPPLTNNFSDESETEKISKLMTCVKVNVHMCVSGFRHILDHYRLLWVVTPPDCKAR